MGPVMEIKDIKQLLSEITQGEWFVRKIGERIVVQGNDDSICLVHPYKKLANARFIAAAPTVIRQLLDRIAKLEAAGW